jgi:hypothetical protein
MRRLMAADDDAGMRGERGRGGRQFLYLYRAQSTSAAAEVRLPLSLTQKHSFFLHSRIVFHCIALHCCVFVTKAHQFGAVYGRLGLLC